jgi:hypothetical protein
MIHSRPLNPPNLGDFELFSPQNWGVGGAKISNKVADKTFQTSSKKKLLINAIPLKLYLEVFTNNEI